MTLLVKTPYQEGLIRPTSPSDANGIAHGRSDPITDTKADRITAKLGWADYVTDFKAGVTAGPFPDNGEIIYTDDSGEPELPSIVTDNLQLYLEPTAYSGSGTSWIDSSTNTYDVTLVGDPAYNTTHFTYNGTTQYVDTNQSLAAESFSVGCWFRTSAAGVKMILSKEVPAGNPWNYRIWLNGGRIVADMSQVTTQATLNSVLTNYNNGAWYNVMFTRDDANWYLYVNGVQVATRADTYTGSVVNSQELWIGRSAFTNSGASPTGSYQYTGDIGEVFIYDAVLSGEEVLHNYDVTKATYGL
jgi:hypothetical protein